MARVRRMHERNSLDVINVDEGSVLDLRLAWLPGKEASRHHILFVPRKYVGNSGNEPPDLPQ